jgi:hypothetical protein
LVYYSWRWNENNNFFPDYFQVPSKVPLHRERLNVNNGFFYTSVKELFQPLLQFMVFWLGFLVKKYSKMTSVKKTTMSIWTSHFVHI